MSSGRWCDFINWYGNPPNERTRGWCFKLTRTKSLLRCWTATWVSLWHIIFSFPIRLFCWTEVSVFKASDFLLQLHYDPFFLVEPASIPYFAIFLRFLEDLSLIFSSRYCMYALNLPEYSTTATVWEKTPLPVKPIQPYRLSLLSHTNPQSLHSSTKCDHLPCKLLTWYEPTCAVNGTMSSLSIIESAMWIILSEWLLLIPGILKLFSNSVLAITYTRLVKTIFQALPLLCGQKVVTLAFTIISKKVRHLKLTFTNKCLSFLFFFSIIYIFNHT